MFGRQVEDSGAAHRLVGSKSPFLLGKRKESRVSEDREAFIDHEREALQGDDVEGHALDLGATEEDDEPDVEGHQLSPRLEP